MIGEDRAGQAEGAGRRGPGGAPRVRGARTQPEELPLGGHQGLRGCGMETGVLEEEWGQRRQRHQQDTRQEGRQQDNMDNTGFPELGAWTDDHQVSLVLLTEMPGPTLSQGAHVRSQRAAPGGAICGLPPMSPHPGSWGLRVRGTGRSPLAC